MSDNTTSPTLNHAHYAGFWLRFAAACIDMVLYVPFYYGILFVFGDQYRWWGEGVFLVFALVTYAMLFASKYQGSPGMYIMGFHICDDHGQPIHYVRALIWGITGTIGWAFCFAGVLYLQSKFDVVAVNDLMRSCVQENITMEDCGKDVESLINIPFSNFLALCWAALGMALFLSFIWALSIALPKDKTGFHNLICRTRFVKGRVKN